MALYRVTFVLEHRVNVQASSLEDAKQQAHRAADTARAKGVALALHAIEEAEWSGDGPDHAV